MYAPMMQGLLYATAFLIGFLYMLCSDEGSTQDGGPQRPFLMRALVDDVSLSTILKPMRNGMECFLT